MGGQRALPRPVAAGGGGGARATAEEALRALGAGLAEALTAVHAAGLLHGSLTPGGVFLATGQVRTGAAVRASDVFSLGAVLAYAATGRNAFGAGPGSDALLRVVTQEPDLAGVPHPLHGLIAACPAKDPRARPALGELVRGRAGAGRLAAAHPRGDGRGTEGRGRRPHRHPGPAGASRTAAEPPGAAPHSRPVGRRRRTVPAAAAATLAGGP
ncbi:hypothetical protein [Streptomyces sp. NPDC001594]|uniref:hypothetical protein n=1 Tax=Streptomyces sp. NPDC001594 TaxID=3364590 RepID=UPI0036A1A9FE